MTAQRGIIAVLLADLLNVFGLLLAYGLHVFLKATFALEALQGGEADAEPCHHAAVGVLGEELAETLLQFAFKIILLLAAFLVRSHWHLPLGCGGGRLEFLVLLKLIGVAPFLRLEYTLCIVPIRGHGYCQ